MARSLPPLNWVRAFEAAARHQSFLRASRELGVSAGAVSQQVKSLEERLGVRLFERQARGVRLNETGRQYRDVLGPALDAIAEASRAATAENTNNRIKITALPAIAERWLIPRMADFQAIMGDVAVQLTTAESMAQAGQQGFDVAIHYETEVIDGIRSMPLFQDQLFPVCSPGFAKDLALQTPQDVSNCRLLYDTKWADDWSHWLRVAGLPARKLQQEIGFSLYNMAVEAAIEGQGILIGHRALIARELKSGRLIAPFGLIVPARHRYVAMFSEINLARASVAKFLDWLQSEAKLP